jgi:non-heme chloroperoxidase
MSGEWWRRQTPVLARDFRVLTIDLRSYGKSEKTDRGHRISSHARDVRELILQLDLAGVAACGWSQGAATIWAYVDQYGTDRLAGAVFVDQSPRGLLTDRWTAALGGELRMGALDERLDWIRRDFEDHTRRFVPTMFVEPPPPEEQEWMVQAILQMPCEHAARVLQDNLCADWRDVLDRVDVPALVVSTAHSTFFPPESGRYQSERMPHARQVVFERSNHCPFLEEADRFNDVVREFVQSL